MLSTMSSTCALSAVAARPRVCVRGLVSRRGVRVPHPKPRRVVTAGVFGKDEESASAGRPTPSGRAPGKPRAEDNVNLPTAQDPPAQFPLLLNNTPHERSTRQWFYKDSTDALVKAVTTHKMTRCKAKIEFPEMNVEGDVYRIGTLLELIRDLATKLAVDGKKVRVCVQGSMGAGVFQALPLSLSGVARILDLMDWGEADEFVRRGSIGKDVPTDDDDYFILIAPQNIVGYAVLPYIIEMEEACGDRPMIMINPRLDDIQSAGNVMSVRGRGERREYVDKWETAYHFRLLYKKPNFFPIFGALRYAGPGTKWELYKRFGKMKTEEYKLLRVYADGEPNSGEITKVILKRE